jgi:transposase
MSKSVKSVKPPVTLSMLPKGTILKQSVGIDVSKDKFQACFSQRQLDKPFRIMSSHSFTCNEVGFTDFSLWITKHCKTDVELHFLMEATGVYYETLAYYLKSKGHRVTVLLANRVKAFAKTLEHRSKTDVIDAKVMAQMALERELPVWTPPSAKMLLIKRLCRERMAYLDEKTSISNRLHAQNYSYSPGIKSLERSQEFLDFLDKKVKEIEKEVQQAIESDADIKERFDKVCSIKGVGLITAATIISETNGFTLFENKAQLVRYAGYDVQEYKSGETVEKQSKISKQGNGHIRKALHFPALVVVKSNEVFKNLYTRVVSTTSIKMKAYVAVQRKLLVLIYTLYKKNVAFDPNYEQTQREIKMENSRQEQAPAYAA